MQTALGGKEKLAAIQDFEECVRAETWDDSGNSHGVVYKRTRWRKPAVLRLDQIGVGDTYVLFSTVPQVGRYCLKRVSSNFQEMSWRLLKVMQTELILNCGFWMMMWTTCFRSRMTTESASLRKVIQLTERRSFSTGDLLTCIRIFRISS